MLSKFIKESSKDIQIGIDIGGHSVKAAAISHGKSGPRLVQFSIKPIGDNIIRAISEAHSELGLTKTRVVTSVSGPTVIMRYVDMPAMTEEELEGAIRFEAEKVIPYNINEVELDARKIETLDDNHMRVMIVAVKKDLIDSQIKILSEAGLEPVIIDIDSFALANAFMHTAIDPDNICGLINIGFNKANINIVKTDKSYLSRDIDIGGSQAVKTISDSMSLPQREALRIMEERLANFQSISEDEKKVILTPLSDMLSRLSDEMRLSFDFYENRYAHNVAKIFISGGMAVNEVLMDILRQFTGRDIKRWNPLSNIEVSNDLISRGIEAFSPQLAVAIGLGLRRPE
jgi:type IV pilus assembly protein PilM